MIRKVALFVVALAVSAGVLFTASLGFNGANAATVSPAESSAEGLGMVNGLQSVMRGALSPAAATAPQSAATPAASQAPVSINAQAGVLALSQDLEAVYQKVNPSVVEIINEASSPNLPGSGAVPQAEGSGFVWDTRGDIVTNDHVVQGASGLQVVFADGTTVNATVVGTDPNGDLAVIKVDPSQVTLVPVSQASLASVVVGEQVVAIGNPFGFSGTMTQGIVSAMGRTIPGLTQFSIPGAIQTDAAINPGNSGGPLLNLQGQVIGVNDQIQSASGSNSGVGFAIPINEVQRIVPALISSGHYSHPYLGIQGATYASTWAQALGLPANARGVYLTGILSGGPAASSGLRAGSQNTSVILGVTNFGQPQYLQSGGDLITAVNGQPLQKIDDLLNYLEDNTSPGQTVQFTVLRTGGQPQTVSVTLGARPQQVQTPLGG